MPVRRRAALAFLASESPNFAHSQIYVFLARPAPVVPWKNRLAGLRRCVEQPVLCCHYARTGSRRNSGPGVEQSSPVEILAGRNVEGSTGLQGDVRTDADIPAE